MLENIKETYKIVKNWFWALPMWKRAIATSFIGAIGGSSIIGFFNKYALYYHAICQDFRVPVEGVEYIDLAITLVSFAFVFTSIIGSIAIYGFLNLVANFFSKLIVKSGDTKQLNKWKRIVIILQAIMGLIAFSIDILPIFTKKLELERELFVYIPLGVFMMIFLIGYIFSKSESSRKMVTLVVVMACIVLITLSLFNQTIYKNFLKNIQYGGEIPIEIEYRKADNTETNLKGRLLIRTSRSVTLRNIESRNVSEVPIERISKIIFIKK